MSNAKALLVLLDQVNAFYPHRDKSSDGLEGDTRHQSLKSDHNKNSAGVVTALDITHDPASGCDSYKLAETIRLAKDPRLQYVISNRKKANMDIQGGKWRPYDGTNPHDQHCHVSLRQKASLWDDKSKWAIGEPNPPNGDVISHAHPVVRRGSRGELVSRVQYLVSAQTDGIFGPATERAVRAFQAAHALVDDGVVGAQTWKVLDVMSEPWHPDVSA